MKSAVVVFPASNCDRDAATALERITGHKTEMVWHQDTELPDVDLVVLPGGFSYGDYLRSGAMASRARILPAVKAHADKGGAVLHGPLFFAQPTCHHRPQVARDLAHAEAASVMLKDFFRMRRNKP